MNSSDTLAELVLQLKTTTESMRNSSGLERRHYSRQVMELVESLRALLDNVKNPPTL